MTRTVLPCLIAIALLGGCSGTSSSGGSDLAATADLAAAPDLAGGACAPGRNVPCTDNQIIDLPLYKRASSRTVESAVDGTGFTGHVDASAGGFAPTESFVYVKFGKSGISRVSLGDEAALGSLDWDLAFRRYLIRLNSGVSGPGCVVATAAPGGSTYDELTTAPAGLAFHDEAYYDSGCTLVDDGSGLMSPGTVIDHFWTYSMCVQMTGQPYLVRLGDGRLIKFVVTSYYAPDVQATCDSTGAVPVDAAGAQLRFRWAVL